MPYEKNLINVLIACLRKRNSTEPSNLSDAQWEVLLDLAAKHGVGPLLYHHFKTNTQIPKSVLFGLRRTYHRNALKNAQYYQELSEILKQLQDIEIIVLKGAYLAKTVYQFDTLRVIGDIDLLVKKADLAKAEQILLDMGYGPTERPSIKEQCANKHHLLLFTKKGAFPIEIHWALTNPTRPLKITFDEALWQHASPFTVTNIQVLSLSPEDLLLHLCFHLAYANKFFGIRFLCDIDKTIDFFRDEIDWDLLFSRARQWDAEKLVYITLYLAKDWLAVEVPEKVLARFKPDDFNLEVVANIKEIVRVDIDPQLEKENNFSTLWMPKSFRERLSIFFQSIFIPPQLLAEMYQVPKNSLRLYFYYLVRLGDLLIRYGSKVWHLLCGEKKIPILAAQNNRINLARKWMESGRKQYNK